MRIGTEIDRSYEPPFMHISLASTLTLFAPEVGRALRVGRWEQVRVALGRVERHRGF